MKSRLASGALLAMLGTLACASAQRAPVAGDQRGAMPSLRSVRVMVMPVQRMRGVQGDLDTELAFHLKERGGAGAWIFPPEQRRVSARAPGIEVGIDALPVNHFLVTEVNRVGDPLFGLLTRLGALVDAQVVLIPIEVRKRVATSEREGAVEVVATLIRIRSGRVIWFGVVEGAPSSTGDFGAAASALEALAETIVPTFR